MSTAPTPKLDGERAVRSREIVRPALTRAQKEVLALIVEGVAGGGWLNPSNLPHWIKNPRQACQILERKGYVHSQWIETDRCYRPIANERDADQRKVSGARRGSGEAGTPVSNVG